MLQYGVTLPAWIKRYRKEWGRWDSRIHAHDR